MSYKINLKPGEIQEAVKEHVLLDRMDMVMDLEKSHGSYIYDSLHDRELLDFFSCFATIPIGYNHPKMLNDEEFKRNLMMAAMINPTNSDIFTTQFAQFIQTFGRVAAPDYLPQTFFIAGGGLAVENAMKVAMDWKIQKNIQKGYRANEEHGTKILHFVEAFHGRTGYTLSVTNTQPDKIRNFAKFNDWPRVLNPKIHFPYSDENYEDLLKRERKSVEQIKQAFADHRDEICAILIEPIQSEGGDNHFRPEYMEQLRVLCDENEALLIYDEVQTGVGLTGKFWAHEHFGEHARPDLLAFGKKMQICGILGGKKVDEVEHNCFNTPSRINSTWGGNLVDMVRSARILQIIEEDNVVKHAEHVGEHLQKGLQKLADKFPHVTNVRGRGLLCAFDLPTTHHRDHLKKIGMEHNVMLLGAGPRSIRFRPTLIITEADLNKGLDVLDKALTALVK